VKRNLQIYLVEHMDEVLPVALATRDPNVLQHAGDYTLEDIYEVPPPLGKPGVAELPTQAGVN
jgi:hypothetical protein